MIFTSRSTKRTCMSISERHDEKTGKLEKMKQVRIEEAEAMHERLGEEASRNGICCAETGIGLRYDNETHSMKMRRIRV